MGNEQTCMTKISNQILITMQEKLKNLQNKCFLYIRCLKNELFMLIMTKKDDNFYHNTWKIKKIKF